MRGWGQAGLREGRKEGGMFNSPTAFYSRSVRVPPYHTWQLNRQGLALLDLCPLGGFHPGHVLCAYDVGVHPPAGTALPGGCGVGVVRVT